MAHNVVCFIQDFIMSHNVVSFIQDFLRKLNCNFMKKKINQPVVHWEIMKIIYLLYSSLPQLQGLRLFPMSLGMVLKSKTLDN